MAETPPTPPAAETPAAPAAEAPKKPGLLEKAAEQIKKGVTSYARGFLSELGADPSGVFGAQSLAVKLTGTSEVAGDITKVRPSDQLRPMPRLEKVPNLSLPFTTIRTGMGPEVDRVLETSRKEVVSAISQTYDVMKTRVFGLQTSVAVLDKNIKIVDTRTKRFQEESETTLAKLKSQLQKMERGEQADQKFKKIEIPEKKADATKASEDGSFLLGLLGKYGLTAAGLTTLASVLSAGLTGSVVIALLALLKFGKERTDKPTGYGKDFYLGPPSGTPQVQTYQERAAGSIDWGAILQGQPTRPRYEQERTEWWRGAGQAVYMNTPLGLAGRGLGGLGSWFMGGPAGAAERPSIGSPGQSIMRQPGPTGQGPGPGPQAGPGSGGLPWPIGMGGAWAAPPLYGRQGAPAGMGPGPSGRLIGAPGAAAAGFAPMGSGRGPSGVSADVSGTIGQPSAAWRPPVTGEIGRYLRKFVPEAEAPSVGGGDQISGIGVTDEWEPGAAGEYAPGITSLREQILGRPPSPFVGAGAPGTREVPGAWDMLGNVAGALASRGAALGAMIGGGGAVAGAAAATSWLGGPSGRPTGAPSGGPNAPARGGAPAAPPPVLSAEDKKTWNSLVAQGQLSGTNPQAQALFSKLSEGDLSKVGIKKVTRPRGQSTYVMDGGDLSDAEIIKRIQAREGPGTGRKVVEVQSAGKGFTQVKYDDGRVEMRKGDFAWRNFNPGNIEAGEFAKSKGAIPGGGRFALFPDYETGNKARFDLLFEGKNYKDLSILEGIKRYAPPHENPNWRSYAQALADAAGVDVNTRLGSLSPDQRANAMKAQIGQEGNDPGQVSVIAEGELRRARTAGPPKPEEIEAERQVVRAERARAGEQQLAGIVAPPPPTALVPGGGTFAGGGATGVIPAAPGEKVPGSTTVAADVQKDRPAHWKGTLSTPWGTEYQYGTGGRGRGSVPYGVFETGRLHQTSKYPSFVRNSFEVDNVFDPKVMDTRTGVLIHKATDLDALKSAGCIAISQEQWPDFKAKFIAFQEANAGKPVVIGVNTDGSAKIELKETYLASTKTADQVAESTKPVSPAEAAEKAKQAGGVQAVPNLRIETPSGDVTTARESPAIVAVGRTLQQAGLRVSEHPEFGGVEPVHKGLGHAEGRAIDVNVGKGVVEEENPQWRGIYDKMEKHFKDKGYTVLWKTEGHHNHMHIEAPAGKELPTISQSDWDAMGFSPEERQFMTAQLGAPKFPTTQVAAGGNVAPPPTSGESVVRAPDTPPAKTLSQRAQELFGVTPAAAAERAPGQAPLDMPMLKAAEERRKAEGGAPTPVPAMPAPRATPEEYHIGPSGRPVAGASKGGEETTRVGASGRLVAGPVAGKELTQEQKKALLPEPGKVSTQVATPKLSVEEKPLEPPKTATKQESVVRLPKEGEKKGSQTKQKETGSRKSEQTTKPRDTAVQPKANRKAPSEDRQPTGGDQGSGGGGGGASPDLCHFCDP